MANPLETTFKNLQTDERYKKLERTLKMTLLKNGERRSCDNGNTGSWPNVSSINSDHFDTSLATMSVQSSRVGSEVVSSSRNLRNILLHKQHFNGPRNITATSSENQFPTIKANNDSAMMPPPSTSGISFVRTTRFSAENQRTPLLNMPVNSGRNTNGFIMSTPASSISSIPQCPESVNNDSSSVFRNNNNYGRNGYGEAVGSSAPKPERTFCRWRVLLNDKGLLIIKGALECGKVARSKPVIRRLTSTRVQSIFKHTYHLQGNLVDDRNELPDYVRGKFYNGFPDDWENVYQVWRNFVNDGNRLSFRWPTPVTDSDDDLKSGITEISYRPGRYKKPVSPRKRNRLAKTPSMLDLSITDNENPPDPDPRSSSYNVSGDTRLETSIRKNHPLPDKLVQSHSVSNRFNDSCKADVTIAENEKSHECSSSSLNATDTNKVMSLKGIIPEEKMKIIIDNMVNKNCPIEYIDKIAMMFDCMKYVVIYQSSVDNESEKVTSISPKNQASPSPMKKDRTTEEKVNVSNTSSSKNRIKIPYSSIPNVDHYDNQLPHDSAGSVANGKSYKDRSQQTRRKLSKDDYETSESDDDFYDDTRRTSTHRIPVSNERHRKTQKYKKSTNLVVSRTSRQYVEAEKSYNGLQRQYTEYPAAKIQKHDTSITDEEFVMERKREPNLGNNRVFLSPRKIRRAGKENRRGTEHYDSSISITEDEERHTDKPSVKDIRKDNYDSSVSITEEEHEDVDSRNRMDTRNYYSQTNAYPSKPDTRRNGNSYDDRKRLNDLNGYSEFNSRHAQQGMSGHEDISGGRKRVDCLNYYPNSNSNPVDQDISRSGDVPIDKKRLDSLKFHAESNSCSGEVNISRNTPLHNLGVPQNDCVNDDRADDDHADDDRADDDRVDDDHDTANNSNPTLKVQGSTGYLNVNNLTNVQVDDSAYLSSDIKRSKKLNADRELMAIESSKSYVNSHPSQHDLQQSTEIPDMPPSKNKTPQVRKKPTVISTETVNISFQADNWHKINGDKDAVINPENSPRNYVVGPKENPTSNLAKNDPISKKSTVDLPEPIKTADPPKYKTRGKGTNGSLKVQGGKSPTRENKIEGAENPMGSGNNVPVAEYGSEDNPKLLTSWVPAVIYNEDGDKKCNLIFEGKLLNEAGHVVDRKFVTDLVRRRLSPKIIETINHDFYKLVGDLNDSKHVVPKELIQRCHSGCPGKIASFCEKWKSLTGEIHKSLPQERPHNTSVDSLSVPMSSRGRRILPPLHYWAGERVVTKDNKTVYNPGNFQESSIPSSLENTTQEVRNRKISPKARPEIKRKNESRATEPKKKIVEKTSPPTVSKSTVKSSPQPARESQKKRGSKRRLTKNMQISSSESDDCAEPRSMPQKRKTKVNDKVVNTENLSTKKLRNSAKKSASPQSPEPANISPKKGSFEKSSDPDVKLKFRKRQKIDEIQGTLQQPVTRRPGVVKCTYFKSIPRHDGDLSEDQLSTM